MQHLCDDQGWALYADCDILVVDGIAKLWELRDGRYAVQVGRHDHVPKETTKFLGRVQTAYARKNWSSFIPFNNARCRSLTLDYVHQPSGLDLHQFRRLGDDNGQRTLAFGLTIPQRPDPHWRADWPVNVGDRRFLLPVRAGQWTLRVPLPRRLPCRLELVSDGVVPIDSRSRAFRLTRIKWQSNWLPWSWSDRPKLKRAA